MFSSLLGGIVKAFAGSDDAAEAKATVDAATEAKATVDAAAEAKTTVDAPAETKPTANPVKVQSEIMKRVTAARDKMKKEKESYDYPIMSSLFTVKKSFPLYDKKGVPIVDTKTSLPKMEDVSVFHEDLIVRIMQSSTALEAVMKYETTWLEALTKGQDCKSFFGKWLKEQKRETKEYMAIIGALIDWKQKESLLEFLLSPKNLHHLTILMGEEVIIQVNRDIDLMSFLVEKSYYSHISDVVRVGHEGGHDVDLYVQVDRECNFLHPDDLQILQELYPDQVLDVVLFTLDETGTKVTWVSVGQRIVVAFLLSERDFLPRLSIEELGYLYPVRIKGIWFLFAKHIGCNDLTKYFNSIGMTPVDALAHAKVCLEAACNGGLTKKQAEALLTVFIATFGEVLEEQVQKKSEALLSIVKQFLHILALQQDKYITDRKSLSECATCGEAAQGVIKNILEHKVPQDQEGLVALLEYIQVVVLTLPLPPAPEPKKDDK